MARSVVQLRLHPKQKQALEKAAEAKGVSLSAFIREAALRRARRLDLLTKPPASRIRKTRETLL